MISRDLTRGDIKVVPVSATEMAKEMGAVQVSNLILLGTYLINNESYPDRYNREDIGRYSCKRKEREIYRSEEGRFEMRI